MILEVFFKLIILRFYNRMRQELFFSELITPLGKDWHYMLFSVLFAAFKFIS